MLVTNIKESNGVVAGGVPPPALRRFFKFHLLNGAILALFLQFFKFQALNGAILALIFHFFTFSNEKVGIVGAF